MACDECKWRVNHPSTADGTIRDTLITNAKAGKFGDIEIDESKSTVHILVHVLEHLVLAGQSLAKPKVYTYSGDDASRDEVRKMLREMSNAPMCVLPKGTLEQLALHSCGFHYGSGSNYCGGCGAVVNLFGSQRMVDASPPILPSRFVKNQDNDEVLPMPSIIEKPQ